MNDLKTLKDALYKTVHQSGQHIAVISDRIDMSENYIYKSCLPDPDMDDRASGVRFPLNKLLPLMRCTNDYTVLHFMANTTGHALVKVPEIDKASLVDIQQKAISSAAEFGDLMRSIERAARDRKISNAEKDDIKKEGWEAIEAILTVLKSCE